MSLPFAALGPISCRATNSGHNERVALKHYIWSAVLLAGLSGCGPKEVAKGTEAAIPVKSSPLKPLAAKTDDPVALRDKLAAEYDDGGVRAPESAKIYGGKTTEKVCCFTFDDGPKPDWTEKLLKELKDAGVKATFFMVGKQVALYPDLAKKIADDGHIVGNHTFTHPQGQTNMSTMSEDEVSAEMRATNKVILDATGKRPAYFRPAGGHTSSLVINTAAANGMTTVFGGPNGDDANPKKSAAQVENEILKVKPGGIIWLHTGSPQTLECLPDVIAKLKAAGWTFVTLDDIAKIAKTD